MTRADWLWYGGLYAVLAGCVVLMLTACNPAREVPVANHATVVHCPPAPPAGVCPALPALHGDVTVEALEDAWVDAQASHARCAALAAEWREDWDACAAP